MVRKISLSIVGMILVVTLGACGTTITPAPTLGFPTPDYTLTAIFSILGTLTVPAPTVPPPTLPATDTQVPAPTLTDTPSLYITPNVETLAPTLTSVAETEVANASATPTRTNTPTNTPVPPTPTPTPMSRNAASLVATFFSKPPTIDGSLGDWDLDWATVNSVVYGRDNLSGSSDLSAKVMIGWDDQYLYLGVKVTDDTYAQDAHGVDLYLGDGLELLLDANLAADYTSEGLSSDDYQLGISARTLTHQDGGEAYLWYPQANAGARNKVLIQGRPTDDGYRVEVAIPWNVFAITPHSGEHYGFAFSVSDNDDPTANKQESMISNIDHRRLTDPTTWGNLILR